MNSPKRYLLKIFFLVLPLCGAGQTAHAASRTTLGSKMTDYALIAGLTAAQTLYPTALNNTALVKKEIDFLCGCVRDLNASRWLKAIAKLMVLISHHISTYAPLFYGTPQVYELYIYPFNELFKFVNYRLNKFKLVSVMNPASRIFFLSRVLGLLIPDKHHARTMSIVDKSVFFAFLAKTIRELMPRMQRLYATLHAKRKIASAAHSLSNNPLALHRLEQSPLKMVLEYGAGIDDSYVIDCDVRRPNVPAQERYISYAILPTKEHENGNLEISFEYYIQDMKRDIFITETHTFIIDVVHRAVIAPVQPPVRRESDMMFFSDVIVYTRDQTMPSGKRCCVVIGNGPIHRPTRLIVAISDARVYNVAREYERQKGIPIGSVVAK